MSQNKTPETDLNKMEINDLPEKKKVKIMVIKLLIEVRRKMDEQSIISTKRQKIQESTKKKLQS